MKIALLLSGGVDSSYSAYLLKNEGYEVVGIYLKLHDDEQKHELNISNVKKVGKYLDIKTHVVDAKELFKKEIYDSFVNAYLSGITPNPCALCNPLIKFGFALQYALNLGCEKVATGHYARIENGFIKEALDASKDQSYFLFGLAKDAIKRVVFPLGGLLKDDIKKDAFAKLPWLGELEKYKESQEICFVEKSYIDILKRHANIDNKGIIKDTSGKVIGEHKGYMHYTIGKRKGLNIGGAHEPHFVVSIDAKTNTIIAGSKEDLCTFDVKAKNLSLPEDFTQGEYGVKVRYRSPKIMAFVTLEDGLITAKLSKEVYGVASGQALVIYDNNLVVGGGWIL